MLLPPLVAMALRADGWWIRSEIIWAKGVSFCPTYSGSCMPSSVKDRPTDSHEMVYLLTKATRYFYDPDAVRERPVMRPQRRTSRPGRPENGRTPGHPPDAGLESLTRDEPGVDANPAGRNLRTVWAIQEDERAIYAQFLEWKAARQGELTDTWVLNPQAYKFAHFACYPEKLVRPCILAGTSEKGACSECGAPWERVVDVDGDLKGKSWHDHSADAEQGAGQKQGGKHYTRTTTGWQPTCSHADAPVVPCKVLDPFSGSGTTGVVSRRLGRDYVGIELNTEYAAMSEKRIGNALNPEARSIKVADGQFDLFGAA